MSSLGMPKGRVGRQGPGRDAGRTGSLVEGWEHPLRRNGLRGVQGFEGPADVNILARRRSPRAGLICGAVWWLPHQAFAEVREVSLPRLGATRRPGRAYAP